MKIVDCEVSVVLISKKKWESLRIADLEGQVQGQQVKPDFLVSGPYGLSQLKQAFREVLLVCRIEDNSFNLKSQI